MTISRRNINIYEINFDKSLYNMDSIPENYQKGCEILEKICPKIEEILPEMEDVELYTLYLPLSGTCFRNNRKEEFIKFGEKFLSLEVVKSNVNEMDSAQCIFENIIKISSEQKDYKKANQMANQFLGLTSKNGETNPVYLKAMSAKINIAYHSKNRTYFLRNYQKLLRLSKQILGEISSENADHLINWAELLLRSKRHHEAYKLLLHSHDIYTELHSTQDHPRASLILIKMAVVKSCIQEYEDARNILARAKKLELNFEGQNSERLKYILAFQEFLGKKLQVKTGIFEGNKAKFLGGAVVVGVILGGAVWWWTYRGKQE